MRRLLLCNTSHEVWSFLSTWSSTRKTNFSFSFIYVRMKDLYSVPNWLKKKSSNDIRVERLRSAWIFKLLVAAQAASVFIEAKQMKLLMDICVQILKLKKSCNKWFKIMFLKWCGWRWSGLLFGFEVKASIEWIGQCQADITCSQFRYIASNDEKIRLHSKFLLFLINDLENSAFRYLPKLPSIL